jgi:hypothetical protein
MRTTCISASPSVIFLVSAEDRRGMAFCFHADRTPRVLGAIDEFEGGLDLVFDHWVVYPRQRVEQGAEEGEPPTLRGEAVLILISESGSGLIYWDGLEFQWYQQGG